MPQAATIAAISGNYRVSKKIRPIIGCTLYYESEGIMGPHTTLTPKIFKLDVHLGYMQVPLSANFPIKTCLL